MVDAGALCTSRSLGWAFSKAFRTNFTESSRDKRNRVMAGLVTVKGLPGSDCSTNKG